MALYAFDGTSREDDIENDKDTNVVRFARAYRGCRIYRSGVGTRYGGFGKVLGGWMGLGLHQRVSEALDALKKNFAAGDRDIDVIGFSRGAAAARHFVNQVWDDIGGKKPAAPPVRFLGLFDTVASTGIIPGPLDINLDLDLPPNVLKCCHAMALDEGRGSFHLQRVKPRKGTTVPKGTIEEVWFRGCHSDIGGGFAHDKLANITLCWMLRRAAEAGVRFDEREVHLALEGRDRSAVIMRAPLDKGVKKRQVKAGDLVHCSVRTRAKVDKLWVVNPPFGTALVDDATVVIGKFPAEPKWPDIDWQNALVPSARLAVGAPPVRLEVFAHAEWNDAPHLFLERGAQYRFTVVDGPVDWIDGGVTNTNGADGYELPALKPFKHLARVPTAEWYSLIGAIDRAELFRIGSGRDYTPQRDGELACFANDAWFKYGNNRGRVVVSVERLA
jgi:hypothetical protein